MSSKSLEWLDGGVTEYGENLIHSKLIQAHLVSDTDAINTVLMIPVAREEIWIHVGLADRPAGVAYTYITSSYIVSSSIHIAYYVIGNIVQL